ncbi:MAG: SUMF1/EgtB/PvdO family nonheme iron enzyme [candidate division Zixibacteria bacterium]|nr:SUMF1/EgtB/PvdO family nonheme iron enzyme [candidate division Zixibacteria bacterium]
MNKSFSFNSPLALLLAGICFIFYAASIKIAVAGEVHVQIAEISGNELMVTWSKEQYSGGKVSILVSDIGSGQSFKYNEGGDKGFFIVNNLKYGFDYKVTVEIDINDDNFGKTFNLIKSKPFEETVFVAQMKLLVYRYEVTNKQYKEFCDSTGRNYPPPVPFTGLGDYFTTQGEYPVVKVSWYDAVDFCNWRSKQLGLTECYDDDYQLIPGSDGFRLPRMDEWMDLAFPDMGTPGRVSIYSGAFNKGSVKSTSRFTEKVGTSSEPNAYGIYDIFGNVWEWCQDDYIPKIEQDFDVSAAEMKKNLKPVCGGSWADNPASLDFKIRTFNYPDNRYSTVGFRPVRNTGFEVN